MKFLTKKIKALSRKHTLVTLGGVAALLFAITLLAGSGLPSKVYAWIIYVYPVTYTPVVTGGYTTISWQAPTSDVCNIYGSTLPTCVSGEGGEGEGGEEEDDGETPLCYASFGGANGSVYTGPINAATTYTISCQNYSGGWGSSDAYGANSITVVPTPPATPTTLGSFYANPSSIPNGSATTLYWGGVKGTNFSSCRLNGGQFGDATWYSTLPGSVATVPLTASITYWMICYDTDGGNTGWRSAPVTVAVAPVVTDTCSNITGNQATAPANGTASGGVCTCNAGFTLQGASCVANPVDACSNIAGMQSGAPTNGSASGGVCSCNAGFTLQGASCVAIPASCTGANQVGTPPNCTCDVGYQMQAGTCVQNVCAGQNEVNWPTCSCATGFTRDTVTSMCIRQAVLNITINGDDAVRVRKGTQVRVSWDATGVVVGSCRVTTNTGTTTGSTDAGTVSTTVANQTTYRLTCTNDAGSSVSKEVNATLIPEVIEQ